MEFSRRNFLQHGAAAGALICLSPTRLIGEPVDNEAMQRAAASAKIAGYSISKIQRWLHEKALPLIDGETGLYKADGDWNYRDTAADCYPFLCWAAHLTDRKVLQGQCLEILAAEQKHCNHIGRIPVRFDWKTKKKDTSVSHDQMVFSASEYVKDGLIAIVEATGKGPWFERMKGIQEDLWKDPKVETPFGNVPSSNVEVNGEQIQALVRLYTMTGERVFLQQAERLADWYLSDPDYVPTRLRDHGCEIIGGFGLLVGVESEVNPKKAKEYIDRLEKMFDLILKNGCNEDGIMFNGYNNPRSGLSDGWGYNYVGLLCWDMATGKDKFSKAIAATLKNMIKPAYKDYRWEGNSIDGYADSIEGAIYLLNRLPVKEGFEWVDREVAANVAYAKEPLDTAPLWGTMKLQANGVRTTTMHALMHTRGLIARPWRRDLSLGAAEDKDGSLAIYMTAKKTWTGEIEFDIPRHREWMGFKTDWPRMNTLPEWYTVEPKGTCSVDCGNGKKEVFTGQQLADGLKVTVTPEQPLKIRVEKVTT